MQSRKQLGNMFLPTCSPYKRRYRTSSQVSEGGWQVQQGSQGHDTRHPLNHRLTHVPDANVRIYHPQPRTYTHKDWGSPAVCRSRGPTWSLPHGPSCHWVTGQCVRGWPAPGGKVIMRENGGPNLLWEGPTLGLQDQWPWVSVGVTAARSACQMCSIQL